MERFRIGRYPFNFQGDLLRDVVVKLNYNFSLIEDLLRQGGVSIDPDNLITINNIEKLIQVINDKISNELNYLVYVYYDGIYHFLSDIEFSDDKVNLIFEGSIIKDGKIVSSTYIITCDLDSEGNILNVTSENSKREYNISGFRVIRIRTKPLEFIDEEDLKLVGEALKDPSNSNSVELSIQDNSSTTNLIPHQSILSTIVSDNEIAHELKFITGENLITAKFTYNSNTKELIGSPSLTESLAPSSETLILSEINDIPSGGRISDENYNRLVLAIENNADIYTTDNTGLIKSVILISDTDNEIILTVKDNNLTEKNIIISKLNNLIKTEKVELATKESVDNKVDKEPGKGLSSNDYTSEEKTLVGTIINKVDKVQGKGLSTYDLTEARKNKLDSYPELTGAGNKALMDNGTFVEITGEGIIFSDIEIINIEDLQVEYVTEEIYNKIANAIINNRHIVLNSINRSDVSPFSLRAAEPINVITYSVIRQEYLNFTNRDILLVITDGTTTTEITIESTFHVTIIKRPSSISLDNSNPLPTVELTQTSIGLQANLVLAKSDSGVQLVKTEDGLVAQFKWDGEDQEIKLKYVTSQEYSSLNEIDQGTLYFITDNRYIMFQGIKYGDNISREEINDIKELLNQKVDKEEGKGLSSNDYSDSDKSKVDKIITSGEGNKYLSDNGEYLEVKEGSFVWDMTFAEQENPNVTGTGGIYTIYGALCQMYSNMSRYGDFAGVDYDKYPSFVLYPKFYTLDFWNKFIQAVKEGTPIFIRTCFLKNPAIGGYMPDVDKENLNIRYSQILPLNVQMSINGNYLEFNCRIPDGSLSNFANPSLSSYRVDKCFYLTFGSHKVENNEIIVENYPTIYPYPSNSSVMPYGGLYNPAWLKEYVTEIPLPNKEQFDIGDKKEDENKVPYKEFSIKESLLDKVYIIPQFNDNSELLNYFDEIKEKVESEYAIYLNVNGTIYPCTVIPISDTIISLNTIAGNSINYAMISVGTYLLDKANNTVTLKDPTLMFNGDRDFVLDSLGNGTKFLSDDGTYKEIESSISPIIIDSEDNKVYTREEIHSILEAYSKGVPIFILDGENIIRATEVVGQRGQGEGMAYLSFYVPKILHEKKSGDTRLDTILISYKYELSEGSSIQVSSEYTGLIGTEDGNKFLSNDGTYKEIQVPSISPVIIDINDTEKVYTSEEITEIYQAHESGRDIYLKFGSDPELRLVNAVASIGDSVILFASYMTSASPGTRSAILDLGIDNYMVQVTAGESIYFQDNSFILPKSGTGDRFLSDDGTYKKVVLTNYLPLSAGSENKLTGDLYFANGTKVSGSEENILSSDAQIEGAAFITSNNSGYIIKDSEGNNRTVLGLDSNNVLGVGVASGKTVLYSNSDLVHYTSGTEYKIWDENNLIDPVTKSGDNTFTGTNSFVEGKFSVGGFKVSSTHQLYINLSQTGGWEKSLTWINNNENSGRIRFGSFGNANIAEYAWIGIGDVEYNTAQYRFYNTSMRVPSVWSLDDAGGNSFIQSQSTQLINFGRSAGTTKIRSGDDDLYHTKDSTNYKILDESNWKRVMTTDEMVAKLSIDSNGYPGIMNLDGTNYNWIRTSSEGILPNTAITLVNGGASALGTSRWAFKNGYIANVYANKYSFGSSGVYFRLDGDNKIALTSASATRGMEVGNLLVSSNYSADAVKVPTNGIFASGRIQSNTAMLVGYSTNVTNGQLGYGLYYAGTMAAGMGSEYSSGALVLYKLLNPNMGKAGYNVPRDVTGTPCYLKITNGTLTLGVGETKAYTAGEDVTVTEYNVLTSKGGALSTGETLDFYAGSEGAGGGIGNCTKGGIWYWFSNDGGVVVGNSSATHVTLRTAADQKLYHQIITGTKYEIITERGGTIGPLTISGMGSTPFVINNYDTNGTDVIQTFRVQGYNRFLVGWSETSGGPFIQRSSDNSCILIKSDGAYWGSSLGASALKKLATQEWVLEQLEALKTS